MSRELLYRRNPLAYPAGVKPGVDLTHSAARWLRFSGVAAASGGFRSLLDGKVGTLTGAAGGAITLLGPTLEGTSTQYATFSGFPAVADGPCTIAAIFSANVNNNGQNAVITTRSSGTTALSLNVSNLTLNLNEYGNFSYPLTGLNLSAANVPYFAAISKYGSSGTLDISAVLTNLITGQQTTVTLAGSTGHAASSSNGSYLIGADPNHASNCKVAAAMYSAAATPLPALLQWAADPWAFWYPRSDLSRLSVVPATSGVSGTLTATEATDIAAFTGGFVTADVSGTLNATEAPDIAAFTGAVTGAPSGTLTAIEAPDIASITGSFAGVATGTLIATEPPDACVIYASFTPPPTAVSTSPYPSRHDYGWYDRLPPVRGKGRR